MIGPVNLVFGIYMPVSLLPCPLLFIKICLYLRRLRLLLGGGRLGFRGLLPVAANHDHAQERADDGRTQKDEDDGYANCPNARGEDVLERVV